MTYEVAEDAVGDQVVREVRAFKEAARIRRPACVAARA